MSQMREFPAENVGRIANSGGLPTVPRTEPVWSKNSTERVFPLFFAETRRPPLIELFRSIAWFWAKSCPKWRVLTRKVQNVVTDSTAHIHRLNPKMSVKALSFGVQAMKPLCITKDVPAERLGTMSARRWKTLASQMVEVGSLDAGKSGVTGAFTLNFVEGVPTSKQKRSRCNLQRAL